MRASHWSRSASSGVVVGLCRSSVSEMIPHIIRPAICGVGFRSAVRNMSATIVQVEPSGRLMKRMG